MATDFWTDFRSRFARGLATILPTALTIAIIVWLFEKIYLILEGTKWLAKQIWHEDEASVDQFWDDNKIDFIGFPLAIILVYIVGLLVASWVGRIVWRSVEKVLTRVPVIKQIYPSIKQVTDFIILNENRASFSRVVIVEYPRKGIWAIGFVTNSGLKSVREVVKEDLLSVFIPSSPTPVTGYTITVRRDEVIDLSMSIEEALRFTVSGGVILPTTEALNRREGDLDVTTPALENEPENRPAGAASQGE